MKKLLCLLPIIFLFSCQKETDETTSRTTGNCKVEKQYIYDDGGAIYDSAFYTYNGNNITKVENSDGYITFEYSNDKIIKRNVFLPGTTILDAYDVVTYNADGTIEKIEQYDSFTGAMEKDGELIFTYTSGKLTNLKIWEDYGSGTLELTTEFIYKYTGSNATQVVAKYFFQGNAGETHTLNLQFDSMPNYLRKQSPQFLLTDLFQFEFDGLWLITFTSENNVIKIKDANNPSDDILLSYTPDSNGNLSTLAIDGTIGLRYSYECE